MVGKARHDGWIRAWPVALTTMLFVIFGGLLSMNGMSSVLAKAAAGLGSGFAVVTPLISALAGYVTGSNSASAVMLAPGLTNAATDRGMEPTQVLAVVMIAASSFLKRQLLHIADPDGNLDLNPDWLQN